MRICTSNNLVKCYDVFENNDLKLIFMEYCNSGSLESLISNRGRINESEAIMIFKQILAGIAVNYCLSRNFIHIKLYIGI